MYKLKEILKKDVWNNFIINWNLSFYSFLQSWEWWELQVLAWKEIVRFWIYSKNELVWVFLLIKVRAKRGNYYFIPHWPLIDWDYFDILWKILKKLKQKAKKDKMCFIRLNSVTTNTLSNKKYFEKLNFKDAPMHEHAEDTHLLDLTPSKDELLSNIKKKDRYYINRAKKEWVVIKNSNSEEQINTLINMHKSHARWNNWKHKYSAFSTDFINNLYKVFWKNINTISATYEWKVESILMTIKFWRTCVYYIAASDIKHPKFSPNYLCQREAILNAKKEWCTVYNFWWISPDDNPKHPIAWVTKFKRKFAWFDYSLLHAQDLVISPKYYLNWIVETFRRIKRWYYYKKP